MHFFIAIFIAIMLGGCLKVNVIQKEGGKIEKTTYYPFSKQKDIKKWDGITPLHLAVINDNINRVKKLLNEGANPFSTAVNPVNNYKITPFEMAIVLQHEDIAKLLAEYSLKNYKDILLNDDDKRITIFALLWKPWPLYTLEVAKKYNYPKTTNHILVKLFNTPRYQGYNGCINLVREIVAKEYENALKVVANRNISCVKEAFREDVDMLKRNFSSSLEFSARLRAMSLYKPYVSLQEFEEVEKLRKKLRKHNEKFNKMIKEIFFSTPNNTDSSSINCQSIFNTCMSYCKVKSTKGIFDDRSSCEGSCYSGKAECEKGKYKWGKRLSCAGICKGVDKGNGGFFHSSSFDKCVDNCMEEIK